MNNINPLFENVSGAIIGSTLGTIPGMTLGIVTYSEIINHKRKSLCKQLLKQMDLDSLLKEAYNCCEYIYHVKGEYRETLYVMCYPKLINALKTKDINKLKSAILTCVSYEVKTPFLKSIYNKIKPNRKAETASAITGSAIGAGLLGLAGYNT